MAATFLLQRGEARGGAIDLTAEERLAATSVIKQETAVREVRDGDGGADGLVERAEFFLEGRRIAIHLEVDGSGLVLPGAAKAPVGGDHLVHEYLLKGTDGFPEGEVPGLQSFKVPVILIPKDEDTAAATARRFRVHSYSLSGGIICPADGQRGLLGKRVSRPIPGKVLIRKKKIFSGEA